MTFHRQALSIQVLMDPVAGTRNVVVIDQELRQQPELKIRHHHSQNEDIKSSPSIQDMANLEQSQVITFFQWSQKQGQQRNHQGQRDRQGKDEEDRLHGMEAARSLEPFRQI